MAEKSDIRGYANGCLTKIAKTSIRTGMPITNIKIIAGVTGPFLETGFARSLLAASSTFLTNLESQGLRNYKLCAQLIP